jgi:DsbC/DsbD-like thiol-disulfide interchange protein
MKRSGSVKSCRRSVSSRRTWFVFVALQLAGVLTALHADAPGRRPSDPATAVVKRETPHLSFAATLTPAAVQPGTRISVTIDVRPKRGMHVYAPGTQYRPIAVDIEPGPLISVHDPVYPEPVRYLFKPLNEQVLVYKAPFTLRRPISVGEGEDQRRLIASRRTLEIRGTLRYQACDDRVCYLPMSIPLRWSVRLVQP